MKNKKKDRIYLRVIKGGLVPADNYAASQLRQRNYHIGDLIAAELVKPRNPKFHRLVHQLGQLVVQNIESFKGIEAHAALKRLQLEGKIACDELGIMVPNFGMVIQLIPRSLSYDSMDEGEIHEVARGISRTIAERYWQDCTPEQIEEMAECMVQETA